MRAIILVAGKKRSGKDTFAGELNNCITMSFAEPLKDILAETLDISIDELDERKNNPLRPERGMLQRLGTEAMKPIFGDNVWADLMVNKLQGTYYNVVIPDFRFLPEYITVRDGLPDAKIITVKIERDSVDSEDTHSSETALNDFVFDYTIKNSGTLEEFKEEIKLWTAKI